MDTPTSSMPPVSTPAPVVPVAPPPASIPPVVPKKSSWPLTITLIAVLVLGYVFWAWSANLWPFSTNPEVAVSPTPSVSASPDAPAGWKTYTDSNYTVQYPTTWKIDQVRSSIGEVVFDRGIAGEDRQAIKVETTTKTLSQAASVYQGSKTGLTVNGVAATRIDTNEFGISVILFVNSGKLYTVTTTGAQMISQGILSTFKFTDATAGWKSYTSSVFGIILSVPSTWSIQEPSATSTGLTVSNGAVTYTSDVTGIYHPTIYIYKQADTFNGSITVFEKTLHPSLPPLRARQTVLIGGKTAYAYQGEISASAEDFRVVFANDFVYTIASNNMMIQAYQGNAQGASAKADFEQILSTFKFTR